VNLYLLDASAFHRLGRSALVAAAVEEWNARAVPAVCSPMRLEICYSARSESEHARLAGILEEFIPLDTTPDVTRRAEELQRRLFAAGAGRAAGAVDLLLAATALEYRAILLHYDRDFDLCQEAEPTLLSQWVVPRGSVA
jgi:predicted nucleic acid-binding protein